MAKEKDSVCVYWFKKDLRLADNEAVERAIGEKQPMLFIYIADEVSNGNAYYSAMHDAFALQSLADLATDLTQYGHSLHYFSGHAKGVFNWLIDRYNIANVYSHEEVGEATSYKRDKEIGALLREQGIKWHQIAKDGIRRGAKNRKGWAANLESWKKASLADVNDGLAKCPAVLLEGKALPTKPLPGEGTQPGGRRNGLRYLHSFYDDRAKDYMKGISKPAMSRTTCSRISPYLAWGCLSAREVLQAAKVVRQEARLRFPIKAFESRVGWRSHFMQKFESESSIEYEPVNKGFLQYALPSDHAKLRAYKEAETGYPLVDACLRCLRQTGYVNFRMRAVLVSFGVHYLRLHWKDVADVLAPIFLDFEPGIHFPQVQMQAGLTGINIVRIYNPLKQSAENDAEALFIKKWVPELLMAIPAEIHTLAGLGRYDYCPQIVEPKSSHSQAREYFWALQKAPEVLLDSKRILSKHTFGPRMA